METITLPTKSFNIMTLQELETTGQLRDYLDSINYIFSYFYEISRGEYYFYDVEKDSFILYTKKDFNDEILIKLTNVKKIKDTINKNNKIYRIVCKINHPRLYKLDDKYYINETGAFLHQNYKQYDEYDDATKSKVQMILDMMKEISCRSDDAVFEAYLMYFAKIARGLHTHICPIKKTTAEGVGKSFDLGFMLKHVYGERVAMRYTSMEAFTSNYNKIFLGKLFIILEDLKKFNEYEWNSLESKLKTLITEDTATYRDLYEKSITAPNISNFIITTNYSVPSANGRRFKPLDIALHRKGDKGYFLNIKNQCFNDHVGEAFFSYLMTKLDNDKVIKYHCQEDFPDTENKILAISNALPSPYKFLKFCYVLRKQHITKTLRGEFYERYKAYCVKKALRPCGKNDFFQKLEEIKIHAKKIMGNFYYKTTYEELKEIADKEKWLCKYDEHEVEQESEADTETSADEAEEKMKIVPDDATDGSALPDANGLDFGIKEKDNKDYKTECINLRRLVAELEKEKEMLLKQLKAKPLQVAEKVAEKVMDDEVEDEVDETAINMVVEQFDL